MKERNQEQIKRNSLQGKAIKNDREVIQVEAKKLKNLIVATCISSAILTGLAITGIDHIKNTFQENSQLNSERQEFLVDVISPNTHRTDNNDYYFYDYAKIAEGIKENGQPTSDKLYYAYANMGEAQTNNVISYLDTDYSTISEYLEQKGYQDEKEWRNQVKAKVNLQASIEEQQNELNQMTQNSTLQVANTESASLGGK